MSYQCFICGEVIPKKARRSGPDFCWSCIYEIEKRACGKKEADKRRKDRIAAGEMS